MRCWIAIAVAAAGCSSQSAPPSPPPAQSGATAAELAKQVYDAVESCLHWYGEEPYDDARAAEISRNVREWCPRAISAARTHYPVAKGNADAAAAIVQIVAHAGRDAEDIVPAAEVAALCKTAAEHYRARLAREPQDNYFPYFEQFCREDAKALQSSP